MTQEINFTLWFQGTKLLRTKVNVPVSLVVCLSQSFKFVHASKLAEAGFTEEVSSKNAECECPCFRTNSFTL